MRGQVFGEKLAGFYPVYETGKGKMTTILYEDGRAQQDRRSVRTFLSNLAASYAVDLNAARRWSGEVAGRKNEVPLPLTSKLILVPLRACKPVAPNDGAIGCFSLFAIKGVEARSYGTFRSELLLQGDHRVPLRQGKDTVEKQLFLAQLIHKEYLQRYGEGNESLLGDLGEKPATKRDIALLIHELCDLRYEIMTKGVRG